MKTNSGFLRILAWMDQVAADPEISDFTLRVALAIAQNASLRLKADGALGARIYSQRQRGELPVAANASASYSALMSECRASKDGVRKAIKALAARSHIEIAPAYRRRPAEYALVLFPKDRAHSEAIEGLGPLQVNRLQDAYTAVARAAAMPTAKPPRWRPHGVIASTPSRYDGQHTVKAPAQMVRHSDGGTDVTPARSDSRHTVGAPRRPSREERRLRRITTLENWEAGLSSTRRAALREVRLREKMRQRSDGGDDRD